MEADDQVQQSRGGKHVWRAWYPQCILINTDLIDICSRDRLGPATRANQPPPPPPRQPAPLAAPAPAPQPRQSAPYTWMLPKTVIDVEIVYTFKDCSKDADGVTLSFDVNPTLTPRAVPDLRAGLFQINPLKIQNMVQDKNISITMFTASHILSSIGSKPTDQTAAIIGNILGGVSKLAGVALGVAFSPTEVQKMSCGDPTDAATAQNIAKRVRDYKKEIETLETEVARACKKEDFDETKSVCQDNKSLDEATIKKDVARIQAYQTLMSDEQKKLSLTIKGTIDPGFGFSPSDKVESPHTAPEPGIPTSSGLAATIAPTIKELETKKWIALDPPVKVVQKTADMKLLMENNNPLQIDVYLDFAHAKFSAYEKKPPGVYQQWSITGPEWDRPEEGFLFREASYIPILLWRGDKPGDAKKGDEEVADVKVNELVKDVDGGPPRPKGPKQLAAPRTIPFAQYGFAEKLPLSADWFQKLEWALTFNDFGEVTNATFTSYSWLNTATSLFGSAASTASSIAGEQQKAAAANSPAAQAAATQAKADEIYQQQRLALCEAHPSSCPSK